MKRWSWGSVSTAASATFGAYHPGLPIFPPQQRLETEDGSEEFVDVPVVVEGMRIEKGATLIWNATVGGHKAVLKTLDSRSVDKNTAICTLLNEWTHHVWAVLHSKAPVIPLTPLGFRLGKVVLLWDIHGWPYLSIERGEDIDWTRCDVGQVLGELIALVEELHSGDPRAPVCLRDLKWSNLVMYRGRLYLIDLALLRPACRTCGHSVELEYQDQNGHICVACREGLPYPVENIGEDAPNGPVIGTALYRPSMVAETLGQCTDRYALGVCIVVMLESLLPADEKHNWPAILDVAEETLRQQDKPAQRPSLDDFRTAYENDLDAKLSRVDRIQANLRRQRKRAAQFDWCSLCKC